MSSIMEAQPVQPLEIVQKDTDNFEDVTDELFAAVDQHLGDMEIICKPKFNFDDTMSSIQINDEKMDLRWQRHKVLTNRVAQFEELEKFTDPEYLSQV